MLVCQCNAITDGDIKGIVLDFLKADPWAIIVPAKVYRELEKRCKCSGCVPNVVDIITKVTEEYHLQIAADPSLSAAQSQPPALQRRGPGGTHERRSASHRAA